MINKYENPDIIEFEINNTWDCYIKHDSQSLAEFGFSAKGEFEKEDIGMAVSCIRDLLDLYGITEYTSDKWQIKQVYGIDYTCISFLDGVLESMLLDDFTDKDGLADFQISYEPYFNDESVMDYKHLGFVIKPVWEN